MNSAALKLAVVVSAPFAENTYIAHLEGRNDCVVVDPGMEPGKILTYLDEQKITPAAVLLTHGHGDHIAGNEAMKRRYPDCPLVIGRGDAPKLLDPKLNLSTLFGFRLISPPADILLDEGDTYEAAGFKFEIREIPGHSSGHIVFICHEMTPTLVFGGDVLLAGSIGRVDFPEGNFDQLADGIRKKLYTLPDDTVVMPGHGGQTTIGEEKRTNPYVAGEE